MDAQPSNTQTSAPTSAMNRQIEQMDVRQCTCHIHPTNVVPNQGAPNQHINLHAEYQDLATGGSQFFQNKSAQRECKVIRILPDEDVHYVDLVRDSVAAQAQRQPKPMFVNNYYVGDNSWRPGTREKQMRHVDKSRS